MLEDAESLAGVGEFEIARELVEAVSSHSDSAMMRSLTREWSRRIDHMQYGATDRVAAPGPPNAISHITRIPDIAPEDAHVARIARDFEAADNNPAAMLLSHREATVPPPSIPSTEETHEVPASTPSPARTTGEPMTSTAELPVESRTVPLLANLVRSFGISTSARPNESAAKPSHQATTPTIIINPPGPAQASVTPSLTATYSPGQVTYFSAICFAIGLLMCPAALLVAMATARRVAGQTGPLFQISVIREESQSDANPKLADAEISVVSPSAGLPQSEVPPIRQDDVDGQINVADDRNGGQGEDSFASPRILSMADESGQNQDPATNKPPNIYRQIVDHNVVLQQNNYRPIVDHS